MPYRESRKKVGLRGGFTLMELLIVVAIIVALAGMGGFYFMGAWNESRKNTALGQVKTTLTQAAEIYATKHDGAYPQKLDVLLEKDPANGNMPYLKTKDAIIDPWGNFYQMDAAGTNNGGTQPDIWCESPFGKIGNWSTK